eukprot:COSAG01_NODE_49171_length_374_cov_1.316364_1_plen_100_part_01
MMLTLRTDLTFLGSFPANAAMPAGSDRLISQQIDECDEDAAVGSSTGTPLLACIMSPWSGVHEPTHGAAAPASSAQCAQCSAPIATPRLGQSATAHDVVR